jgi:carboxypeptidase Taq
LDVEEKLRELQSRLAEIGDLRSAASLLSWDQMTHMPPGGARARARQGATLRRLAHERLTDPALGRLLEALQPHEEGLPYDSDEASLIRVARRDFERAVKVPAAFAAEMSRHRAESYQAWTQARPANDFAAVEPYLERTLELSRQYAGFFPGYDHIADPLIDDHDYGLKAASIQAIFAALRQQLVPLAQVITEQPPADDSCLRQRFPAEVQLALSTEIVKRFGYDFARGRQDLSPHPFTIGLDIGDTRITTRVQEGHLGEALFSTMHEAGHAMYEQGIHTGLEGTPLAHGTSSGVHESQSRLWENVVGRSRRFWTFFYPRLQAAFADQLGDVPLETFYRAINKVERSLIRTDADEVTYNLHVMLRFDLELALLEGTLAVRHLPEAWNERYRADLGIAPPDDRDGVLQDVHWFSGTVGGMFQGYTLGNILAAHFFQLALEAHPEINAEMERGEFSTLHGWLQAEIYQHGRKFTAPELVKRVTGEPMTIGPYVQYLQEKYGELYDL